MTYTCKCPEMQFDLFVYGNHYCGPVVGRLDPSEVYIAVPKDGGKSTYYTKKGPVKGTVTHVADSDGLSTYGKSALK